MSTYLKAFKELAESGAMNYELMGDNLIVEKIKEEERKVGGLFIASVSSHRNTLETDKPHFVRVLAVGKGFYNDETKEPIDLDVKPGDIILVGPVSVKYFSYFGGLNNYEPDSIGITKDAEILLKFKGEEGYNETFNILNRLTKKQVGTETTDRDTERVLNSIGMENGLSAALSSKV